jgi:hypothetical protein
MSESSKIKVLKPGALIKGIDISYAFYERLSALMMYLVNPDELSNLKKESPEEFQSQLETMLILFATIDEAAQAQGLVEESELPKGSA